MNLDGRGVTQKGAKAHKPRAKPLRDAARDQPCALRLSCCNGNTSTTVLAHLRMFGWAGTAQKPPDFLAVFACSACHDALDGRAGNQSRDLWTHADVLRALGETLIAQNNIGNL